MAGKPLSMTQKAFDDAKLAQMTEPLTIRIERIKNGQRTPLPLPDNPDGSPGNTGWQKADIHRIEGLIANEIPGGGGGLFEVMVTDSTVPPVVMKWTPFFSSNDYPERGLTGEQFAPPPPFPPINPVQSTSTPVRPMPPQFPPPQYPPQYAQYPQAAYYPPMPAPPPFGTPAYGAYIAEADRRAQDAEVRKLREDKERQEREALEARHRAELERERQLNAEKFSRLENTISSLISSMKEAAAPKESAEVLALREQIRMTQEQARRAEERAEIDRRERETKELILQLSNSTKEQMAAMQRQFEATLAQLTSTSKMDPVFTLMQEQARQNSEAIKELARANKESIVQLQANMMNPREMIALARENQQGIDAATERVSKTLNSVLEMQQRVTENALQLQPQGGGALEVVREGVSSLTEFAKKYVNSKTTEQQIAAAANVQIAQAQAHAIEAQARATAPQAFVPPPPLVVAPPASTGLNGAPAPAQEPAKPREPERLWGRTDMEWFGEAVVGEVFKLRQGVARFLESCAMDPVRQKNGEIDGIAPDKAAQFVVQAAGMIQKHKLHVPAMAELLERGLLGEFIGLLLPDAHPQYQADVLATLKAMAGEESDKQDEEDEEDEEDEVDEAKVVPAAPPAARRATARA